MKKEIGLLSKARENILNWYPFGRQDEILEFDAQGGLITSMLCKRVKRVVALEFSESSLEENIAKNEKYENLEILLWNANRKIEEQFDYVILNNNFAYAQRYMGTNNSHGDLLRLLKGLLKPEGKILIATENRLGLDNFAGAPEKHTKRLFSGLNEELSEEWKTFSKSEWIHLLSENGLNLKKIYYPYPNHFYPNEIFTDETIGSMGYGRDYYNCLAERLMLFDEGKVAQSLIREGVVDVFANSFLIEATRKELENKTKIIYVKINSDRAEEFQIATSILEEKGEYVVYKYPLNKNAQQHIKNIHFHEKQEQYGVIQSLLSEKTKKGLKYPFLKGQTLDNKIKEYIKWGEYDRIILALDNVFSKYFSEREMLVEYETEKFQMVFGKSVLGKRMECVRPANIDLICDNIFEDENQYYIIDCEWIFDFYVPKKFIIWRNINELVCKYSQLQKGKIKKDLLTHYQISLEEEKVFLCWNEFFTLQYVKANQMSQYAYPKKMIAIDNFVRNIIECELFVDRGSGYSEAEKIIKEVWMDNGDFEITYKLEDVENIKAIRWEPLKNRICICKAYIEIEDEVYKMCPLNGTCRDDEYHIFLNYNPQYQYRFEENKSRYIRIFGEILYPTNEEIRMFFCQEAIKEERKQVYVQILENHAKKDEDEIKTLIEKNKILIEKNKLLEEKIVAMENTKGWKILEIIRKVKG